MIGHIGFLLLVYTFVRAQGARRKVSSKSLLKELPLPATFLIGLDTRIRLADINIDYTGRLDPKEIIAFLTSSKRSTRAEGLHELY